jgi:hypothetical protein
MFKISDRTVGKFNCYYNGNRLAPVYSVYWGLLGVILTLIFTGKIKSIEFLSLISILLLITLYYRDGKTGLIKLGDSNELC